MPFAVSELTQHHPAHANCRSRIRMLSGCALITLALAPLLATLLHPVLHYALHAANVEHDAALLVVTIAVALIVAGLIAGLSTALRELRRVAAAWRAAEASDRHQRHVLATMAHEVRSPMHAVAGILDLLRRDERVHEEARRHVSTVHDCVTSLLTLVGNTLDRSKIDAGRMQLDLAPTRIDALLEAIVQTFAPLAASRGLTLQTEFSPLPHHQHLADAPRIRQVLANLLGNAIKFSQNGTVFITLAQAPDDGRDAQAMRIRIADCGTGIAAHDLPRVFEPFFQAGAGAHATASDIRHGTGLGLSISRDIARAMDGDLEIASESGVGTVASFTLRLAPATDGEDAPATQVSMELANALSARLLPAGARVLAVDDHPVNRMVLERQLLSLGLDPDVFASGEAALDAMAANSGRFHWLITDCHMQGMTGADLAAAVRERERELGTPALPIVGCTADMRATYREQALAAGMDACLLKPVSLASLEQTLAALLPRPRALPPGASDAASHVAGDGDGFHDSAVVDALLACNATDLAALQCALRDRHWRTASAIAHRVGGAARLTAAHDVAAACDAIAHACAADNHEQAAHAVSSLRQSMENWGRSLRSRVVPIDPR